MNQREIEPLIEKYFEGLTTLEEEQCLRDCFQQDAVSTENGAYQAMFRFFASEREAVQTDYRPLPGKSRWRTGFQWLGVAATVCLLVYAGLKFNRLPETSCAYISGKACTNHELIQSETLKSLESLSQSNESVFASQVEALSAFFE
jgi:hypothetical protein